MKKQNIIMFLNLLLFIFIPACDNANTGIEGEWNEFIYTKGSKDNKRTTHTKVLVEKSYYKIKSGRVQLTVEWRAINTSQEPTTFSCANKVIMDKDGRVFEPFYGRNPARVQPLDATDTMTMWYDLPKTITLDELYWGLCHDLNEGLKYKIKLIPENK